jgi:hypothetical protein
MWAGYFFLHYAPENIYTRPRGNTFFDYVICDIELKVGGTIYTVHDYARGNLTLRNPDLKPSVFFTTTMALGAAISQCSSCSTGNIAVEHSNSIYLNALYPWINRKQP